jgi:phage anti-repressor protein
MDMEIIKVIEVGNQQTVLGRDLHGFLEVDSEYTTWFNRMCEYGFVEGVDFNSFKNEEVRIEGKRSVRRELIDHQLTLSMAKEIAMLQRSERGKQARQYFIECERRAQAATPSYLIEDGIERAQAWIEEQKVRLLETKRADEAEQEVTFLKAQPKQLDETTPYEVAKELGIYSTSNKPHFQLVSAVLKISNVHCREFWHDDVKQYQKVYGYEDAMEAVRSFVNGRNIYMIHIACINGRSYKFKLSLNF